MIRMLIALSATLVLLGATGCREEGPAEKAGRQIDEAVEDMSEKSEGALERLGREVDEAVEETKEAADEVRDAAEKAGS